MRPPREVCLELVAALKAAGFTGSSIDPELVNPPAAVWVQPREIHSLTFGGGGQLTVWLYALAPDVETDQAMAMLDDALDGLLSPALGLALAADAPIDLNAAVVLPGRSAPLPAYRLAVDLDL